MNRRQFLQGAAAAAAGVTVGGCATANRSVGIGSAFQAYDVVVVGGGPAGVCAAIAAALSVKVGAAPRNLKVSDLVAALRSQKVFLG